MMQKVLYVGFVVSLSVSSGAFVEGMVGLGVGTLMGAMGLLAPLMAGASSLGGPKATPKR